MPNSVLFKNFPAKPPTRLYMASCILSSLSLLSPLLASPRPLLIFALNKPIIFFTLVLGASKVGSSSSISYLVGIVIPSFSFDLSGSGSCSSLSSSCYSCYTGDLGSYYYTYYYSDLSYSSWSSIGLAAFTLSLS